ncbi:MAG: NAD(P)/FAD-dependent oxidoreductase [Planctomycetes bacterium]|nr:NAD(P)/FAD-dependent oxidoreductase [Planctomycetota bacterium]
MVANKLKGIREEYDVIVVGSGLAGLTGANVLSRMGRSVLLLEHHYRLGGLATWFRRKRDHIFDVSLHGFPSGMIKSCRKYWNDEIASSIRPLRDVRFINPQFNLNTTFELPDFKRILGEVFGVVQDRVESFFETVRKMPFYGDKSMTIRELFERFFPGRSDVVRFLLEPIYYANGSTLDDPAVAFSIVFSNFINRGVFSFAGGTDQLIRKMTKELEKNGVDIRNRSLVEKILIEDGVTKGVIVNGQEVRAASVMSNANLKTTILRLAGEGHFCSEFIAQTKAVRLNNSSTQVYMGLKEGALIPDIGDLVFTSKKAEFNGEAQMMRDGQSRTYSVYPPDPLSGRSRSAIVSSTNARYEDWADLDEKSYRAEKKRLIEDTMNDLSELIPDIRDKIDWIEAGTPRTLKHYTLHQGGASFGTKFEGLSVSEELPRQVGGLFHAGSVGIIMSGWLGAINYGVIVANNIDRYLGKVRAVPV